MDNNNNNNYYYYYYYYLMLIRRKLTYGYDQMRQMDECNRQVLQHLSLTDGITS